MGDLLNSIMNLLGEGIVEGLLAIINGIANLITGSLLAPFTFATPEELTSHFVGLGVYMDSVKIIGCAIVIMITLWSILQYMFFPDSSTDSAGMIVARFFLAIYLVLQSEVIIATVLKYGDILYQQILGSGVDGEAFRDVFLPLTEVELTDLVFSGASFISSVVFGGAIVCVLAILILWNFIKVWFQLFERFANFAVQIYLCPVTLCTVASRVSQTVFSGWFRSIITHLALLCLDAWFIKVFVLNLAGGFENSLTGNGNTLIMMCMLQIAYLKVVQNAERMLENWGLIAMSSGNMVHDINDMMSTYRSTVQLMTGRIPGFGSFNSGGANGNLGRGGILGATAKAGEFMRSHGFKGNPVGAAARAAGGAAGAMASGVRGKGFRNGWEQGTAKAQAGVKNMNQKAREFAARMSGTKAGAAVNQGMRNVKSTGSKAASWVKNSNSTAAKMSRGAIKGAGIGSTIGAGSAAIGAVVGAGKGAFSPDIKRGKSAVASDLRDTVPASGRVKGSKSGYQTAQETIGHIDKSGNSSYRRTDMPLCMNTKESRAMPFDAQRDMGTQARSLFGDGVVKAAQAQGMGKIIGGSYNADTGSGAISFEKKGADGSVTRDTISCFSMTGDINYRDAHDLAAQDPGSEHFVKSTGADGNEYVCYRGHIPEAMRGQEEDYARDTRFYEIDESAQERVNDAVAQANTAYANNPDNIGRFLDKENGYFVGSPSEELKYANSGAYEALSDWAAAHGIQTDESPGELARAYHTYMEKEHKDALHYDKQSGAKGRTSRKR